MKIKYFERHFKYILYFIFCVTEFMHITAATGIAADTIIEGTGAAVTEHRGFHAHRTLKHSVIYCVHHVSFSLR